MCVIIVCESGKPDLDTLQQCQAQNSHGAGIAWREGGVVKWKKGIQANEVHEILQRIELPAVIHFRMATQGGISDSMCHPFPVNKDASIAVEGTATKVLFHNGHWNNWEEAVFKSALSVGARVPEGVWSDSRAMAWLVRNHGPAILKFIERQKICLFSNTETRLFGEPWFDERKENGLMFSNKLWASQYTGGGGYPNYRGRHGGRIGYMRNGVYVTAGEEEHHRFNSGIPTKEVGSKTPKDGIVDVEKERHLAPPEEAHGMMVWGDHACGS